MSGAAVPDTLILVWAVGVMEEAKGAPEGKSGAWGRHASGAMCYKPASFLFSVTPRP